MFHYQNTSSRRYRFSIFLLMSMVIFATFGSHGQTPQLSLADILIGLRSKKVTIAERNTLLTDAVKTRGITFTLTPEIERELVSTGAGLELVWAIREKSPKIIIIQTPTPLPTPEPTPTFTPTPVPVPTLTPTPTPPPDSAFYRTQAAANILNAKFDLAVADYDKALEINPKDSMTYFFRGDAYEKIGDVEKAVADYQKAVELDENNEPAKNNLWRLLTKQAKIQPSLQTKQPAQPGEALVAVPLSVEVGELNNYAVNLVAPTYPDIARKLNTQGKVLVQITLDKEGNVISAKAVTGHQMLRSVCEDAAFKSKFKPIRFGNQAVKATGFLNYSFVR